MGDECVYLTNKKKMMKLMIMLSQVGGETLYVDSPPPPQS